MNPDYDFMHERITEDYGEAFEPSRFVLRSKCDAIVQPYRTYDLFFEETFHVHQKLGVYEDLGSPDELKHALEDLAKAKEAIRKLLCYECGCSCGFCKYGQDPEAGCFGVAGGSVWCNEYAEWSGESMEFRFSEKEESNRSTEKLTERERV